MNLSENFYSLHVSQSCDYVNFIDGVTGYVNGELGVLDICDKVGVANGGG